MLRPIVSSPSIQWNPSGEVTAPAPGEVTLTALGDLMLAGEWDEVSRAGSMDSALAELAPLCRNALTFANLEATAPGDGETIEKQPRLIGRRDTLTEALQILDVDVVSLANNHTFDACLGGFREVRSLLEKLGVEHLGAGEDLVEASQPRVITREGMRFGFLAYNHDETRPSHVAGKPSFGVRRLEEANILEDLEALVPQVDHVVLSLHWGVEYCHLPSPAAIGLARRLVDAGARLILGHHAHVVQGVEVHGKGVIAYNLGNALTTDLDIDGRLAIYQNTRTRSSFALRASFSESALEIVELVPFYAGRGRVTLDHPAPQRLLRTANRRLTAGVSEQRWKRVRLYEDVVKRTAKKLHPRVIRSVRPHHFVKFFKNIAGAASGRGPAA